MGVSVKTWMIFDILESLMRRKAARPVQLKIWKGQYIYYSSFESRNLCKWRLFLRTRVGFGSQVISQEAEE